MRGSHLRSTIRSVVAILCAASFLAMSLGSVSRAVAADAWETWPKKTTVPGAAPKPETDANAAEAAKAGEAAEEKTAKGKSSGTIWWIAAGTAVAVGIAIAIAAGGSGGEGPTTNPGHQ
jgi:hypothetical protein